MSEIFGSQIHVTMDRSNVYFASVVLIPSVGSADVENWPFHSHRWLRTFLPPEQRHIKLWTFDYTFPVDDNFKCENIWVLGERLLKAMKESLGPKESNNVRTNGKGTEFHSD